MQRMLLLVVAALVLGGGFFHVLREDAERERLERRVEALQQQLDALQTQLEERPSPSIRPSSAAAGVQPDSVQRSAGASIAPAALNDPRAPGHAAPSALRADGRVPADATQTELLALLESQDPAIRERMRRVVADHEQDLREEERERRQAAWEERTNKRLETLARSASLSQQQVDALFGILTANRDRIGETFRAARETHDFAQAEQQVEQHDKQADEEARAVLDAKQFEAYKTMRAEGTERRGWGRREAPAVRPPPER